VHRGEGHDAAGIEFAEFGEMGPEGMCGDDEMDGDEVFPAGQWKHGWGREAGEDRGEIIDTVRRQVKHGVPLVASR
jgi:hypothetical protein